MGRKRSKVAGHDRLSADHADQMNEHCPRLPSSVLTEPRACCHILPSHHSPLGPMAYAYTYMRTERSFASAVLTVIVQSLVVGVYASQLGACLGGSSLLTDHPPARV
jgi:hypothetical protein